MQKRGVLGLQQGSRCRDASLKPFARTNLTKILRCTAYQNVSKLAGSIPDTICLWTWPVCIQNGSPAALEFGGTLLRQPRVHLQSSPQQQLQSHALASVGKVGCVFGTWLSLGRARVHTSDRKPVPRRTGSQSE